MESVAVRSGIQGKNRNTVAAPVRDLHSRTVKYTHCTESLCTPVFMNHI
jgi:hypothetical protein